MSYEDLRTWAEIDLARLDENYREIRRVLPEGCRFAGLCKANAYGHGIEAVGRRLEALGAECIAVSCYSEALELRSAGIRSNILILAPSPAVLAPAIAELGCTQSIGDAAAAAAASEPRLFEKSASARRTVSFVEGLGSRFFSLIGPPPLR